MGETKLTDLIARAQSGDEAAVRELVGRLEPYVRRVVHARMTNKLRTRSDQADFVQEAWQSAFADLGAAPRELAHLRRFLDGLVRNKILEQSRRLTRTAKYDGGRKERLDDRLAQLTAGFGPREIEVLMLRRQGLTHAEVAERTGLSQRSARRIIELFRSRPEGSDEFRPGDVEFQLPVSPDKEREAGPD